MSFREKTAWIMSAALLLGGAFYGWVVVSGSQGMGATLPPLIPIVILYTLILVTVAIAGHVIAALSNPADANAPLDERERLIGIRSAVVAQYVFGAGVLLSLGVYLLSYDGHLLFHLVFGSLMLAQFTEYAGQILMFRRQT